MDSFGSKESTFTVYVSHLSIFDTIFRSDRLDILDAERQYVLIGNRIDDGIGMQTIAKELRRGEQGLLGILCKYRRAGEAEDMVFVEALHNQFVHIAKLRTVTLIEDDDDVLVVYGVLMFGLAELIEFLDRGNDDTIFFLAQLFVQYGC